MFMISALNCSLGTEIKAILDILCNINLGELGV